MKDVFIFALNLHEPPSERACAILCRAADEKKVHLYRTARAHGKAAQSMASQVLLRYGASRAMGVPMREVHITYTEQGKPLLNGGWHCSISHTDGVCICAVARREIGIDIEKIRPYPERVAEKYFSKDEQDSVLFADNKDSAFFEIWTKHESFVKLTGEGLCGIRTPIPESVHTYTFRFLEMYTVSVSMFTDLS